MRSAPVPEYAILELAEPAERCKAIRSSWPSNQSITVSLGARVEAFGAAVTAKLRIDGVHLHVDHFKMAAGRVSF